MSESETGESVADIVAEMRDFAEHRDFDSDGNMDVTHLRIFAARIEAAAKHDRADAMKTAMMTKCEICERLKRGNAAKLREALETARTIIGAQGGYWADKALPIIVAALSAPPRNCDRFKTADAAWKAWNAWSPKGVPLVPNWGETDAECFAKWLFAGSKGGAE